MAQVRVYAYDKCGTCKKALAWLRNHGVEVERVPIQESPPSAQELLRIREWAGVPTRKLFNTSGQSYRAGGWKDRLTTISDEEALEALAADGMLIKRPLVVGENFALVGFNETDYSERLGS